MSAAEEEQEETASSQEGDITDEESEEEDLDLCNAPESDRAEFHRCLPFSIASYLLCAVPACFITFLYGS